jgi:hypothetical protein
LSTTARQTRTTLSSDDLIWHLIEEASTIKLEANVNKAHAALAAAHGGRSNKGPKMAREEIAKEKERNQVPNVQTAKSKDIPPKFALPKAEGRSIKPQTGGNKNRRPKWKRRARNLQMQSPKALQNAKIMLT